MYVHTHYVSYLQSQIIANNLPQYMQKYFQNINFRYHNFVGGSLLQCLDWNNFVLFSILKLYGSAKEYFTLGKTDFSQSSGTLGLIFYFRYFNSSKIKGTDFQVTLGAIQKPHGQQSG